MDREIVPSFFFFIFHFSFFSFHFSLFFFLPSFISQGNQSTVLLSQTVPRVKAPSITPDINASTFLSRTLPAIPTHWATLQ